MANDPRQLVVLGFDSVIRAEEAFLAMNRLVQEGKILLHDAVFVSRDGEGRASVRETTDPTPGAAALDGTFWGLLFGTIVAGPVGALVGGALSAGTGALMAKLIDTGVPDAKIDALRQHIDPGTTALALLVSHLQPEALRDELKRFAGVKVLETDLPEATAAMLREAVRAE
ncbi:MAG: DUF1269 domain-containing protein [Myxococcales bacterium]|nr:DUF1269 domain-containing protein [Myxococcales bacterium]